MLDCMHRQGITSSNVSSLVNEAGNGEVGRRRRRDGEVGLQNMTTAVTTIRVISTTAGFSGDSNSEIHQAIAPPYKLNSVYGQYAGDELWAMLGGDAIDYASLSSALGVEVVDVYTVDDLSTSRASGSDTILAVSISVVLLMLLVLLVVGAIYNKRRKGERNEQRVDEMMDTKGLGIGTFAFTGGEVDNETGNRFFYKTTENVKRENVPLVQVDQDGIERTLGFSSVTTKTTQKEEHWLYKPDDVSEKDLWDNDEDESVWGSQLAQSENPLHDDIDTDEVFRNPVFESPAFHETSFSNGKAIPRATDHHHLEVGDRHISQTEPSPVNRRRPMKTDSYHAQQDPPRHDVEPDEDSAEAMDDALLKEFRSYLSN
eukprot:m.31961 g.31961  ORF g.31961 m.31961 type:complete len:372 (-) comp9745_c0_seq1:50-1165(-)